MYAVYNIFLQRLATKFTVEISALNNYESEVPPISDNCVCTTYVCQVNVRSLDLCRFSVSSRYISVFVGVLIFIALGWHSLLRGTSPDLLHLPDY
jgi:hypothetical protein